MRYRTLGRTGIQVSPYALGAMNFGAMSNADHDDSIRIIHRALDAGLNLIDTADVYSRGESEEIVGKAIKGRREDVVLATKFSNPMGEAPNQRGASRRWIWYRSIQSVPSRRRLFSTSRTIQRRELPNSFGSSPIVPWTLVASTTLSRRPPVSALPTISSDSPRE